KLTATRRASCPHCNASPSMPRKLVLGITGASGAIYGVRLLDVLRAAGCELHLSISASGQTVIRQELGLEVDLRNLNPDALILPPAFADESTPAAPSSRGAGMPGAAAPVRYYHFEDLLAPIASGSFLTDGM